MGRSSLRASLIAIAHKKKIKYGCITISIQPFSPKAMDGKTQPSKVYIATNMNNVRSEKDYTTQEEDQNNQQWGEEFVVAKLLHIAKTIQHPTSKNLPTYRP